MVAVWSMRVGRWRGEMYKGKHAVELEHPRDVGRENRAAIRDGVEPSVRAGSDRVKNPKWLGLYEVALDSTIHLFADDDEGRAGDTALCGEDGFLGGWYGAAEYPLGYHLRSFCPQCVARFSEIVRSLSGGERRD